MKTYKILKFYQTYRLYIFPAVVAVSGVFLILFAIYPQTIKVINNQKNTEDLLLKTKLLESKVDALENYNEEDLVRELSLALAVFPSEKDFPNIFGILGKLVSGSGFSVNSIALESSASKLNSSNSFGIKMEVKGSKNYLAGLLNNLENSPRLLKINNIEISSNQVSQTVDIALGLEVLYAETPQNAGTIDSPLPQLTAKDREILMTLGQLKTVLPDESGVSPKGKVNPFE